MVVGLENSGANLMSRGATLPYEWGLQHQICLAPDSTPIPLCLPVASFNPSFVGESEAGMVRFSYFMI